MSLSEVEESLKRYFWYDKTSKAGNWDRIFGQVVHPPMGDNSQDCNSYLDSSNQLSEAYDATK